LLLSQEIFAMPSQTYFLVSLPTSISPSNDKDEAFQSLRAAVSPDHGAIFPFSIPTFKIGTLDALVQQADDLAKLEKGCEAVVNKIAESLKNLLDGDEQKIHEQKVVNDSMAPLQKTDHNWSSTKSIIQDP
jgi:V-type H+-transporting ATPase subunit C